MQQMDYLFVATERARRYERERGDSVELDDCPRPKKERAIFRINRFNNLFETIICHKLISYL